MVKKKKERTLFGFYNEDYSASLGFFIIGLFLISCLWCMAYNIGFNNGFNEANYEEVFVNYKLDKRNWIEEVNLFVVDYTCTTNIEVNNYQKSFINSDSFFMELKNREGIGECNLLVKRIKG